MVFVSSTSISLASFLIWLRGCSEAAVIGIAAKLWPGGKLQSCACAGRRVRIELVH